MVFRFAMYARQLGQSGNPQRILITVDLGVYNYPENCVVKLDLGNPLKWYVCIPGYYTPVHVASDCPCRESKFEKQLNCNFIVDLPP